MTPLLRDADTRCILALSGSLPPLSFFEETSLPIYAVDGAANNLVALGASPELILGDFDSVHSDILRNYPSVHLPDQNASDFEKALLYLGSCDLLPAIIVGIGGGYIDHVINNINIFMNSGCIFYAPPIVGFTVTNKTLSLPLHTKLSLLGIPSATVSTTGLKWNLDNQVLTFPGPTSCFNRSLDNTVSIKVHDGSLLCMIYLEQVLDAGI